MRNLKKLLALTLALVLSLALGATAFAYDPYYDGYGPGYWPGYGYGYDYDYSGRYGYGATEEAYVSIFCNEKEVYSTSRTASGTANITVLNPETLTALSVNGEAIALDVLDVSLQSAQTRFVNGANSVDGVYRVFTETINNTRVLRIYWSGLRTALYVDAFTGYRDSYQVKAAGAPSGAVTITGAEAEQVAAGSSWSATFAPKSNYQAIKALHIVANNVVRDVQVPVYGSTDINVAGQAIRITRNNDDTVTVSMASVVTDVSVTAQIYNYNVDAYKLNVLTPKYITSNVSTDYADRYAEREVIFTPARGYAVGNIRITDGNKVGTLTVDQNSIRLNGKTYSVSRLADGRVALYIPYMTADVTVEAGVEVDGFKVEVLGGDYVTSSKPGVNNVAYGDGFTVTFYTSKTTYYTGIEVTTAKGTYTAAYTDDSIKIDGVSYRIYRNVKGDVTLTFDRVPCDMTIAPTSREVRPGYNKVVATTDKYLKSNAYDTWVYNGDDTSVTFALTDEAKLDAIRQIRVTYNGKTYYADPANDATIKIGNKAWDLELDDDGCVTVYMTNVSADVEIYASVTEKGAKEGSGHSEAAKWTITKTADSHSTITYTGKAPFEDGEETTVRVYTDDKYVVKSVTFTMSGKTATVAPFDKEFTLNGEVYAIAWTTNGDMSVKFPTLTSNMTVKALSTKGDLKRPDESPAQQPQQPAEDVTQVPTEPDAGSTPIDPSYSGQGYHAAYMVGYDDGTFRPDNLMTRAQALTVLGRLHAGLTDEAAKGYATAAGFVDVSPNSWYAGYVGYAKQQGYLNNWLSAGASNFNPEQGITRAEFVVLLCNFTGQNLIGTSTTQVFSDVPASHWAYNFINYCAARGWALGYDDSAFHPDECLTRAQICALLNRINNRVAGSTSGYMANQFYDVAASSWYFNDVMEATNNHYVSGTSNGVETWAA